jgi:hypothetical protein
MDRVVVSAREALIWIAAHIVSWLALSPSPASFRRSQAIGIVDRFALNSGIAPRVSPST